MKNFSFILILPSSEKRKKIFLDKHILYLCNFCHCSAHPPHALPSWFFPCRLLRTRILLGGCMTRFLAGSWHIGQSLIYLGVRFRSSRETSILMIMIKLTFLLLLKTYEMSCLCNSVSCDLLNIPQHYKRFHHHKSGLSAFLFRPFYVKDSNAPPFCSHHLRTDNSDAEAQFSVAPLI